MEYQRLIPTIELATKDECIINSKKRGGKVNLCIGSGYTVDNAINDLTQKCKLHKIETPILIPGADAQWYCGTFEIEPLVPFLYRNMVKYNTVWLTLHNKNLVAYVYY